MTNPTWFEVARRPRWIAGLVLALAVAFVFALLGQWQLERSFTVTEEADPNPQPIVLVDLETPGAPLTVAAANKFAKAQLYIDTQNVFIVANRLQRNQDGIVPGYWVIANSSALLSDGDSTGSLSVGIGFAPDLATAEQARASLMDSIQVQAFIEQTGKYLQTEGPIAIADRSKPYLLESFSLAQLVNLYSGEPAESFAGFLVLDSDPGFGLEQIVIAPPEAGTEVNWLTLFYAVEWALFGAFAIFLWWRLVEDQRVKEMDAEPVATS